MTAGIEVNAAFCSMPMTTCGAIMSLESLSNWMGVALESGPKPTGCWPNPRGNDERNRSVAGLDRSLSGCGSVVGRYGRVFAAGLGMGEHDERALVRKAANQIARGFALVLIYENDFDARRGSRAGRRR